MSGTHEAYVRRLLSDANTAEMAELGNAMMGHTPTRAQVDAYQRYLADIAPDAEYVLVHVLNNLFWDGGGDDELAEAARRATVITLTAFVASTLFEARRRDRDSEGQEVSERLADPGVSELPVPGRD